MKRIPTEHDPLAAFISKMLTQPYSLYILESVKDTVYIVETPTKHVWITPTCIRNHHDVVQQALTTSGPGGVREWKRYGLIIAIDWDPRKGDPDTQEVYTERVPIV